MPILTKTSSRFFAIISLIIAGETIFFLPFVLARIFRPTLLTVFNISNTELGTYFSAYGVMAMLSYFFGGPLADKYPARNLLSLALLLTGLGGLVMWLVPVKGILMALYSFWGFTTILLFWAALIRATREWGGSSFQSRAFGWLEGGRGATAALLGTITVFVFADFNIDSTHLANISAERIIAFRKVILFTSLFTLLSGALAWWFIPNKKELRPDDIIRISQICTLLKNPSIWLLAIIIICGYVGYKITDDFSLYANEVLGFNEIKSAGIGTGALWMRALVAISAGYLADKVKASKVIILGYGLVVVGGGLVVSGLFEQVIVLAIINLAVVMTGVYGVRALYFALVQEAKIPIFYTGTAVGIISVLGFTPDIFMSPWIGYLLDKSPGSEGHHHVFVVLCLFAVLGLLASLIFIFLTKKRERAFLKT